MSPCAFQMPKSRLPLCKRRRFRSRPHPRISVAKPNVPRPLLCAINFRIAFPSSSTAALRRARLPQLWSTLPMKKPGGVFCAKAPFQLRRFRSFSPKDEYGSVMRISKSRRLWLIGAIFAVLVAVLAGFFFSTCVGIVHEASLQELHSADAIVVFGAAEYSGRPSPVYRARLDHAFELFQRGMAPVIVTTGGAAADPTFSEGGVGHDYLKRRGVPDSSLIAETH